MVESRVLYKVDMYVKTMTEASMLQAKLDQISYRETSYRMGNYCHNHRQCREKKVDLLWYLRYLPQNIFKWIFLEIKDKDASGLSGMIQWVWKGKEVI